MERIENRMVRDSAWDMLEKQEKDEAKLNGPGYLEVGTNNFVPEEDAFGYALDRCLHGSDADKQEFMEMLVEWFYSGNWIKENGRC